MNKQNSNYYPAIMVRGTNQRLEAQMCIHKGAEILINRTVAVSAARI